MIILNEASTDVFSGTHQCSGINYNSITITSISTVLIHSLVLILGQL